MAAAIIAIRNNHSEILDSSDGESEEKLLDRLRSTAPSKENREAELLLSVSILG